MVESLTPNVLQANDKHNYSTWYITMQLLFMLAFTLWIHSLFTLGGVYLRKYSFVLILSVYNAFAQTACAVWALLFKSRSLTISRSFRSVKIYGSL